VIRGIFLADSHLGIDWPSKPRVHRRRRGDDFYGNYLTVLGRAAEEGVDFLLHGGDLFYRSRVPDSVVIAAFEPLLELAEAGTEIFIVPGNHERSRLPASLFAGHDRIHIFDRPRSFVLHRGGATVELSGLPFRGQTIRRSFPDLVEAIRGTWTTRSPDLRLLCLHEIVEGARVGPSDYQFMHAPDTIRCEDLPEDYAAILSGHIHRMQILTADPAGRPLRAPVMYPGSIERTSFAERDEVKGYMELDLVPGLVSRFRPLPARPMETITIDPEKLGDAAGASTTGGSATVARRELLRRIRELNPESVVRIRLTSEIPPRFSDLFSGESLRSLAPDRMNISIAPRFSRRVRT